MARTLDNTSQLSYIVIDNLLSKLDLHQPENFLLLQS